MALRYWGQGSCVEGVTENWLKGILAILKSDGDSGSSDTTSVGVKWSEHRYTLVDNTKKNAENYFNTCTLDEC